LRQGSRSPDVVATPYHALSQPSKVGYLRIQSVNTQQTEEIVFTGVRQVMCRLWLWKAHGDPVAISHYTPIYLRGTGSRPGDPELDADRVRAVTDLSLYKATIASFDEKTTKEGAR
jgi:hypothetical protein